MPQPGAIAASDRWSRLKVAGVAALVMAVAIVLGAVADQLFHLRPIVAEKFWIAGLASGIAPVQDAAIRRLRDYPTRHAAVSLVVFINVKNLHRVPDPRQTESPEERARRLAKRAHDLKLAERATETLCLLSGRSFGTNFWIDQRRHFWGSLAEDRWPGVLEEINLWAARALGNVPIPPLS
jgi:hypothetical protein